jgi:hypothetical protein
VSVRATLAAVLLSLSTFASALAQDVDMPAECGTPEAFQAEVRELLGARTALLAAGISVELRARRDGGYRLRVALPEGERVLQEPSCNDLMTAAALIVASSVQEPEPTQLAPTQLALNLDEPTARPSATQALAIPQPVAVVRAPMDSGEHEASAASHRLRIGAGVALVGGVVPALSAGLEATLGLRLARLEPTLALRYTAPREAAAGEGSVRVQALSASFVLAYVPWSWLRVGAGAEALALRAQGRDLSGADVDWAFTFGPRLEAWAAVLDRERSELLIGAAGLYQVQAARFVSADGELLHAASSWGFQAGVRGAWEFF